MNIISLVKTNTVQDIPKALRLLADEVEKDIAIQGHRANAIGMFDGEDGVFGEYDYHIDQTNMVALADYLDNLK